MTEGGLKLGIVGMGSFGTALAHVAAINGHIVHLIGRDQAVAQQLNQIHRIERYLPGVALDPRIQATTDSSVLSDVDLIVLAVPSHAMRSTCRNLLQVYSRNAVVLHATKGLEVGTNMRMSEVIHQEWPDLLAKRLSVLSGPSHAEEVSRQMPTTLAVASVDRQTAEFVQDAFMNEALRVYTNPDVIGTEVGGALKNIIAIGCGISDGLSYGDNAKAAIMTRGLVEITRIGVRMGAAYSTFSGLTGVGDLIVTCTSKHSRNWHTGYLMGRGHALEDALEIVGMVVEGVRTTRAALGLAAQFDVHMPIAEALYDVLFEKKPPREAVSDLMRRMRRHETEEYVQETTAQWQYG